MLKFSSPEKWGMYTVFILVGVYTLAPFLFLNLYNNPATDDYFFAVRDTETSFWESQLYYFLNHSGRFFATAIVRLNPLTYQSFIGYKIYSLCFMLSFIGAAWLLIYQLFKDYFSTTKLLALLAILVCVYLIQMPNISQGIYWFTGYMTFQVPNLMFLLFWVCISMFHNSQSRKRDVVYLVVAALLAIAIIGSNEMTLIMLMSSLLLYLISFWQKEKPKRNYLLVLFIVCLIISLIVVLAPGNYIRMEKERSSVSFIEAALGAIVFTGVGLYKWGIVLLVMSLIYTFLWGIPVSEKVKNSSIFKLPFLLLIVWFFSTIALMNFVYTWSAGERAVTRVENVIYFFFVVGWVYILQYIINKHLAGEKGERLLSFTIVPKTAFAIFFLLLTDVNNNISTAYLDLLSGRAEQFDDELKARYSYLKSDACYNCAIDPISTLPKSLYIHHMLPVEELDEMGIRGAFVDYWGKNSVTLNGPTPEAVDNMDAVKNLGKKIQHKLVK